MSDNAQQTNNQGWSEPAYVYRLQLSAPDPEKPEDNAVCMFGMDGDTPEILVWPRGESQKGKGPIKARLNTTAFGRDLVHMLRQAAAAEGEFKSNLKVEANRKVDGVTKRVPVSTIVVAKRSSDGVIVFGLFDQDDARTRILFPLLQSDWVSRPTINGVEMTDAEFSKMAANYYADWFEKMAYDKALHQTMAERKKFMDDIRERREQRMNGGTPRPAGGGTSASDFEF